MTSVVQVKRGDTLSLACSYSTNAGEAIDLTSYTITAQLRASDDTLLADLDVAVTSAVDGEYTVGALASVTADWAVDSYVCDIQYTSGSSVTSTATFRVEVLPDVTRAA